MGAEKGSQTPLNSAEGVFLEVLEGDLSQTELNNFLNTLSMNSEQMMVRLGDLMERLNQYKVDPRKASLDVKKAWELMGNFITSKSQHLQENDLVPNVYGSMVYDDAYNLDFDLNVVGQKDLENIEDLEKGWEEELSKDWVSVGTQKRMVEGHISYISFETLERHSKALADDLFEYADENGLEIYLDFLHASSILMGTYPYSDEKVAAESVGRFIDIIRESPTLCAYTIWNLEQVLIDREVRRAGLDDRQTGEDNYKTQLIADRPGISPELIEFLKKKWSGEIE